MPLNPTSNERYYTSWTSEADVPQATVDSLAWKLHRVLRNDGAIGLSPQEVRAALCFLAHASTEASKALDGT